MVKVKIVFNDDNQTKVIRGVLISEDDFGYKIKAEPVGNIVTIGKRALIKISEGEF